MSDGMTAMKFEDQKLPDLDDYATLAEQFIPGRRAIFAIVEASFLELLARGPAKVLVVGAGGGEEILRLGLENPSWSFVGVDTYQPMIDLARRRLAGTPVGPRSDLHATTIEQLADGGFDAATCILTAHFVPDDGAKLAFFKAIRARLKPGASRSSTVSEWPAKLKPSSCGVSGSAMPSATASQKRLPRATHRTSRRSRWFRRSGKKNC